MGLQILEKASLIRRHLRNWVKVKFTQLCLTLCDPIYSPWSSPGWNTGGGSLSLLQGIFPTQESNWGVSCIAGGFFTSWATREAGCSNCFKVFSALMRSQSRKVSRSKDAFNQSQDGLKMETEEQIPKCVWPINQKPTLNTLWNNTCYQFFLL